MLNVLLSPFQKFALVGIAGSLIFFAGFYKGNSYQKEKFDAFKTEMQARAKAQEMINKGIEQRNKLIAENVKNEYETRLANLRNYYNRLRHTDSSKLPTLPQTTHRVDESTTDPIFIGQCAETTLMLSSLQSWLRAINENEKKN